MIRPCAEAYHSGLAATFQTEAVRLSHLEKIFQYRRPASDWKQNQGEANICIALPQTLRLAYQPTALVVAATGNSAMARNLLAARDRKFARWGRASSRAYRRSDALEKRHKLMDAWAAYASRAKEADRQSRLKSASSH